MADETKETPKEGQSPETKAPETPDSGQAKETTQAAPSNKFEGKSPEELAKAYVELEKKLGEQSQELGESRKYREQVDVVLQAIWADKDIYNSVDKKIRELRGAPIQTDTNTNEGKPEPQSNDTDTRKALETQIIDQFEKKFGLDQMESQKRRDMHTKIGTALAEMLDPGGTKTYQEILNDVSLARLPKYLDNAYFLANREELQKSITQSKENEAGAIGSIPSSSGRTSDLTLSASERDVAEKMGVTEEKYLERKKQIAEQVAKGV